MGETNVGRVSEMEHNDLTAPSEDWTGYSDDNLIWLANRVLFCWCSAVMCCYSF